MPSPAVSTKTTQRIDRLLRSLVGVADVRMLWRAQTLRTVHILRASGTQPHQLIRNVVSGLQAGFGIQVLPTQIHVHEDPLVFEAIEVTADLMAEADAADAAQDATPAEPPPAAAANGAHHNGNGRVANGNGNGAAKPGATNGAAGNGRARSGGARSGDARRRDVTDVHRPPREEPDDATVIIRPSSAPAEAVAAAAELVARRQESSASEGLTLERIDVERRGGMLRCRTVLALGDKLYSAIAEVPDSPSAEAELAARVAVDALRAGGLTTALLDGVGFITIAKTNYCVATVREPGRATPRASAAPLIDSMAASATAAVLTALGSFTDARDRKRTRAGH